jgi:hypothetical protein
MNPLKSKYHSNNIYKQKQYYYFELLQHVTTYTMMANNRNGISEDKTQLSVPKSNLKIIDIKAKSTSLTHIHFIINCFNT